MILVGEGTGGVDAMGIEAGKLEGAKPVTETRQKEEEQKQKN